MTALLNVLAWKKLHYGFYTANNGIEQRFSMVFEQYGQLSYQRIALVDDFNRYYFKGKGLIEITSKLEALGRALLSGAIG